MVKYMTRFCLLMTVAAWPVFAGPVECVLYYRSTVCGIGYDAPQKFDIVQGASGANELWWREWCAAPDLAAICHPTNDAAAMAWVANHTEVVVMESGTNLVAIKSAMKNLKGVAQTNKANVQAVVAWTNGMTAGQQRSDFNDMRRELIDANDTIIELTRLVRKLLKETKPYGATPMGDAQETRGGGL